MSYSSSFLADLHLHQVRNLSLSQLKLHPRYNIFFGDNGSGKTSVLEAIYLLSTGHSFKTRETSPLIRMGEPTLTVFARTTSEDTISIQKNRSGPTLVKIDQQVCNSSSQLAHFLPCQVFYQDIFQIIDAGPATRRSLLDWGLFHVKPSYHDLWKDYRRVLKQRNALLRNRGTRQQCAPWDKLLASIAHEMDALRQEYFSSWKDTFQLFLTRLTDVPCSIAYYKGWDRKGSGKELEAILHEQFPMDAQRQYTHSGPHQADILFVSMEQSAKKNLSRGQQKIILLALKLSQAHLLAKPCIYLFDDITTELDLLHLKRLFACFSEIKGQFFLTTLNPNQLNHLTPKEESVFFSVQDGQIQIVSRETIHKS